MLDAPFELDDTLVDGEPWPGFDDSLMECWAGLAAQPGGGVEDRDCAVWPVYGAP